MAALLYVAMWRLYIVWRLCWDILMENNNAQVLLAGFVACLFGLRDALGLDLAVGDGGLEFGGVDDAGADDVALGGDVHLHTDLSLFVDGVVDVVDHPAGAGAVVDAAARTTALARTDARAIAGTAARATACTITYTMTCAGADATSGTTARACTAAAFIHTGWICIGEPIAGQVVDTFCDLMAI